MLLLSLLVASSTLPPEMIPLDHKAYSGVPHLILT